MYLLWDQLRAHIYALFDTSHTLDRSLITTTKASVNYLYGLTVAKYGPSRKPMLLTATASAMTFLTLRKTSCSAKHGTE
jgi:hypothetical protein